MKCEEFNPQKYAEFLMIIGRVQTAKNLSKIEDYLFEARLHLENCARRSHETEFREYLNSDKLRSEDLGLISEGLEILEAKYKKSLNDLTG